MEGAIGTYDGFVSKWIKKLANVTGKSSVQQGEGYRGRVYRACCPINNPYSVALRVTDLVVYGSHDGRRRLAGSDLELSG